MKGLSESISLAYLLLPTTQQAMLWTWRSRAAEKTAHRRSQHGPAMRVTPKGWIHGPQSRSHIKESPLPLRPSRKKEGHVPPTGHHPACEAWLHTVWSWKACQLSCVPIHQVLSPGNELPWLPPQAGQQQLQNSGSPRSPRWMTHRGIQEFGRGSATRGWGK